jgi:ABC-type bacteriocin/lantibiotic exporter with double-glycine peptidase domain
MATSTSTLTPLQRFWGLLKPDNREITQLYIYAIFNGLVMLSLPLGIQAIINLIQGGQISTSWVVLVAFVIVGITFSGILQIMQLRITENLQQKIFTRASFEFAYRIPRFKLEALYRHYAPELINRFFDAMTVQKGLSKILLDFSTASLQVVFGLVLLSLYHPVFIMFSVLLLLLVFAIFRFTARRGIETSLKESKHKYEIAHWLEELARTNFSFKLAGQTPLPMDRANGMVHQYLHARESHYNILKQQYILLISFKVIVAAGLLVLGGILVMEQELNIGQFVAAELIILYVMNSVEKLIINLVDVYDVLTALEKLGQVVDMELENPTGDALPESAKGRGMEVHLENITFHYPESDEPILHQMNLHIPAGKSLIIQGSNGSGKSTLLNVLAGLYQPQSGAISYNGLPLGNLDIAQLRQHIGACLTQEMLFHGTLAENISMGRTNIPFDDVRWAADMMGLQELVRSLPKGYNTVIDPGGRKLSRSVIQKILLARAVANRPKLLLLEDPLDKISPDECKRIIEELTHPNAPWTLVAVSNNKYLQEKCSMVATMANGSIADLQFTNTSNK